MRYTLRDRKRTERLNRFENDLSLKGFCEVMNFKD